MFKRKILALLLVISTLFSTVSFASNNPEQDIENEHLTTAEITLLADELEEEVSTYLETQDTNIIEVLKDMKNDYEEQIAAETDVKKLEDLKILSEQVDEDIKLMESQENFTSKASLSAINVKYDTTLIACKTYFYARAYQLSHELVSKFQVNKNRNLVYSPQKKGGLYNTSVIQKFRKSQRFVSGTDRFAGGSTRNEKDGHYAINKFSYTQRGYDITISDTYDFQYGDKGSYNNIVQSAVNILAQAQKDGYFIPFKISLKL